MFGKKKKEKACAHNTKACSNCSNENDTEMKACSNKADKACSNCGNTKTKDSSTKTKSCSNCGRKTAKNSK